jgi:hypothetical protein
MDDMTWMSSFYEPPFQPLERTAALAVLAAAVSLVVGWGGVALAAWPRASVPAGSGVAAGPVP